MNDDEPTAPEPDEYVYDEDGSGLLFDIEPKGVQRSSPGSFGWLDDTWRMRGELKLPYQLPDPEANPVAYLIAVIAAQLDESPERVTEFQTVTVGAMEADEVTFTDLQALWTNVQKVYSNRSQRRTARSARRPTGR